MARSDYAGHPTIRSNVDRSRSFAVILRTSGAPNWHGRVDGESVEGLSREGGATMWDTVQANDTHLSHDMPCQRCGHALHTFLGCDNGCDCQPALMPGESNFVNA